MVLFIHDATRHMDDYIVKYMSESLEIFKELHALGDSKSDKQGKTFRTERGSDYTAKWFAEYLKPEGILKEITPPYTSPSNEVIKVANRTIMEHVRCMLDNASHLTTY